MNMHALDFYKALADETRLLTLLLIHAEGELCVCELTEALAISQPKVSRHLATLRSSGLLTDRREGQWVYYRIPESTPDWAQEVIALTASANQVLLSQPQQRLEAMGGRPERQADCCPA